MHALRLEQVTPRMVRRLRGRILADPLRSPKARDLTRRFLRIRQGMRAGSVRAAMRLGRILDEGRRRWYGQYGRWLRDLDVSRTSACQWRALFDFRGSDPELFRHWEGLGSSKLYDLSLLRPVQRTKFLAAHDRAELLRMSERRFKALTLGLRTRKARRKRGPRPYRLCMQLQAIAGNSSRLDVRELGMSQRLALRRDLALARSRLEQLHRRL